MRNFSLYPPSSSKIWIRLITFEIFDSAGPNFKASQKWITDCTGLVQNSSSRPIKMTAVFDVMHNIINISQARFFYNLLLLSLQWKKHTQKTVSFFFIHFFFTLKYITLFKLTKDNHYIYRIYYYYFPSAQPHHNKLNFHLKL